MMKKNLLLLSLLLAAFTMNAQYTVEDQNGTFITEGSVWSFGVTTYPEASLDFFVNNTTSSDIYTKIEFVSAINADGSQMELCYGLCYTGITIGAVYPPNNEYVTVPANGQTGPGNHFYNADPGNGSDVLDYVFRFYQTDNAGNELPNTSLTFTYRYDPLLGLEDLNEIGVRINSTIITNSMEVNLDEEVDLTIYDLQGRIVHVQKLGVGYQTVDMASLTSQVYIVQFTNYEGASKTAKVVVK